STCKRRLERGRELLRIRLTSRGLALSAGLCAAVPALLAAAAVRAAAAFAVGTGAGPAAALAEEVLRAASVNRLKSVLALVLTAALTLAGAGLAARRVAGPRPPAEDPPAAPAAAADEKPRGRTDEFGDPLPDGARFRLGTLRFQHGHDLWDIVPSPDGKAVAAISNDRVLSLWEVPTGKDLHRVALGGDTIQVFAAFSPDGRTL